MAKKQKPSVTVPDAVTFGYDEWRKGTAVMTTTKVNAGSVDVTYFANGDVRVMGWRKDEDWGGMPDTQYALVYDQIAVDPTDEAMSGMISDAHLEVTKLLL
jgi:hypothetical protein